ncbi:glycosyl hydrolase [Aestuariivivens sp. NBU2969]|uniref:WD40/YVTN/BNR-like repeat-containing protein n=1 Tax=Aestuariivivens sp. NBU2969 TaxID=2873267 RepID=UPI001CBB5069|nr:glycosyl hydrolase [Aestuariivivens sp. NBU2969]
MRKNSIRIVLLTILSLQFLQAQRAKKSEPQPLNDLKITGLKWRNIGPAVNSGRVSDFAVNPNNPYEYYIATASGGVWKTTNAGIEYAPIFDKEGSYSIGCVTMDPNNPNVIWVGTGENNGQRSVAYGDGVYKSIDGGATWKNMGLENSEHIGKIIVHPENSNIVYVAAIGPLWNKGGDRGVYKTVDGGENWMPILAVDEHTGINDIIMDTRDPNVLYAAAHQRRRHVYTYVGGGPGSGLHKSTDGGDTWIEINKGLPEVELGRIGLAQSPVNPEILYAIVEAGDGKGGFFRSTNRGASWEKRSDYVTSGNYYQEIVADPIDTETVYSMNTWLNVSYDGGKTFTQVGETYKHVDNHCMWINPNNNQHWLVGCDGGIYETFNAGKHWDFKENLPVTQFYKVAVDNDTPFYNVYGGTQDNFSLGGPSRVVNSHGITNQDWIITHGGDGFESQVDPTNPDIVYAQSQYGWLVRYDKKSGEEVGIKPTERKNENQYRWNWDAPLVLSRHDNGTLFFAANKVFRSNDFGNSWEVISEDLTRQINRNQLQVYDRVISIDAVEKNGSTSPYGTIVALSESPINKKLLAVGTDDGLIQITDDGGKSWKKIDNIPNAPKQSYVNAVYLSQHDVNVMYAVFNHHKYGDFKPYVFKSTNKGQTWSSISNNLPERGSVYAIEEDPIKEDLIFCGTEFGVYFSPNGGHTWKALDNGLPTIAVRDIAIQQSESDLVLATFGRGFYILDDYSVLRTIENKSIKESALLYPVRDALIWEESTPLGLPKKSFMGDNFFSAENLGPQVMFTYYYNNTHKTLKESRQEKEKEQIKDKKDVAYPSYESLKMEVNEIAPKLVFVIKDNTGKIVKKVYQEPNEGIQRFHWDMRYEFQKPIKFETLGFYNPWAERRQGTLVAPGAYTVEMNLLEGSDLKPLATAIRFNIKALDNTIMPATDRDEKVAFQRGVNTLQAEISEANAKMADMRNKLKYIKEAIKLSELPIENMTKRVMEFEKNLEEYHVQLNGDPLKVRLDMGQPLPPSSRVGKIINEQKYSTASPTKTHLESFTIAKSQFSPIKESVQKLYEKDIKEIEKALKVAGAPYTPGRLTHLPQD